jgi:hypothetical protein
LESDGKRANCAKGKGEREAKTKKFFFPKSEKLVEEKNFLIFIIFEKEVERSRAESCLAEGAAAAVIEVRKRPGGSDVK